MMKKFVSLLLAVLMLALPVMGLAQSPDEMFNEAMENGRPGAGKLTFEMAGDIPGMDAEMAAMVEELVEALGFTLAWQDSQVDFAFQLSGNDALTLAVANDGQRNYIKSNLLGEDVAAFTAEEGQVILNRMIDLAVQAELIPQSEAAALKQSLEEAMAQVNVQVEEINLEDLDLTPFIGVAMNLASKVQTGEVTAQPKNCDAAATMIAMTLNGEDVKQIYAALFSVIRSSKDLVAYLDTFAATAEMGSGEELLAELEKATNQLGDSVVGDIPVTVYMDEAGEPVYASMAFTFKTEDGGEMKADANYTRLTTNAAQNHSAVLTMFDQENTGVNISVNASVSPDVNNIQMGMAFIEDGVSNDLMRLSVLQEKEYGDVKSECDTEVIVTIIDGEEMNIKIDVDEEAEKINDVDVRYSAEIELSLPGVVEEVFTVNVDQVTGEAAPSIISADALLPGAMTDDEFNAYAGTVMEAAQTALINMIQYLPSSVLMLLFQ